MKKIVALTAVILMATASLASAAALTSTSVSNEAATIYGGISQADAEGSSRTLIGKLSKSTKLGVRYSATEYALTTKHSSGNTQYGTAYDATAIYKKEVGSAALAAPTATDRSAFGTWTAM